MPKFIDTSPPDQCIFCRLVAGAIPAARVYEDALTLAFMDIGQVNPGHVLVATRRHAANLFEITPQEAAAVMQTARRVALAVRAAFDPPGLTRSE
ncbi:MAG: HIT domain-containing protein, partial [Hydrogenophaga sp.]|uniref:HIT family protein n=1 Tax=Hydrogenophaga sp. TaxID=1904254 RepID=UPI002A36F7A9